MHELIALVTRVSATDDPLGRLASAVELATTLERTGDAVLGHFVDQCRHDGYSWSEIGVALGVTRQAAHKRFAVGAEAMTRHGRTFVPPLERAFEAACRGAIEEIRGLGFTAGGWLGRIDRLGGVGAAHEILARGEPLPVLQFALRIGRSDLSLEAIVLAERWASLFSDKERDEACRRLMGGDADPDGRCPPR